MIRGAAGGRGAETEGQEQRPSPLKPLGTAPAPSLLSAHSLHH